MFKMLILLLITTSSYASTISFTGACSESPFLTSQSTSGSNLGDLTIKALTSRDISFEGDQDSIQTMFGLKSSGVFETMQEDSSLSPNQIRFYGWCYEVNGEVLSILASEYQVKAEDKINWFYGYVLYDQGQWGEMCQKSHLIVPEFLCGE